MNHGGTEAPRRKRETENRRRHSKIAIVCGGIVLLLWIGLGFGVQWYRLRKASAFCKEVGALPQSELADYASKCDFLWSERGGRSARWTSISDATILNRFHLAGRNPEIICLDEHMVSVHYLRAAPRSGAMVQWEDYSQWGDAMWKLRAVFGDGGGNVIYTQKARDGEPEGVSNRSQPIRLESNQTSGETSGALVREGPAK